MCRNGGRLITQREPLERLAIATTCDYIQISIFQAPLSVCLTEHRARWNLPTNFQQVLP